MTINDRRSPLVVLHVTPTLGQGGAERLLHALAAGATACERHVVVTLFGGGPFEQGLETYTLNLPRHDLVGSIHALPKAGAALAELVRQMRTDVVQGWLYYGNLLTRWASPAAHAVVWSIHNTSLPPLWGNIPLHLARRCGQLMSRSMPDAIVYCAESARSLHEKCGYDATKSLVIDNGVDAGSFSPPSPDECAGARASLGLAPDETAIGLFCRWDPQKDVPGTLMAISAIARRRPGVRPVLVGAGMDAGNAALMGILASADLLERTICLGMRTDVERLLPAMDLLVLGSAYGEAMPMVLLEALFMGVPVATTRIGDVMRLPLPECALAPLRNPGALAEAIDAALSLDRRDAAWQDVFAHTRRHFTLARYRAKHSRLYRSLVSSSGS